ncbi:NADH dehydrogenase, FAD-containing subunit [Halovivax ruber XH-70]|uniref:NADH dehydrogenase, FAD-containing subunit n=1 Tax=Halovivax ruber (strain DSM 18193 / JCM 13892 / XH-70) TaxID=797302 RepID=L0I9A6_HALRX|nr:FAD-dependent oxidoreductase [Halovivax ruber]AGB15398.1 NADH dehydrogenase, FAD-containing subunit [Halovivax ruber XH-70]
MHVVVLGGGYAGVAAVRRLEHLLPADVDLTLATDTPDHVLQHELHRVLRRPAVANDLVVPLTQATDRTRIRVATVDGLDRENRTVSLSSGTLAYDYCVVCLGTQTAFHGLESVRERATPVKRIRHALAIRDEFRTVLDATTGSVRIVVGGAGLSGVQVAGELAALANAWDAGERTTVTLLEQRSRVAPNLPARFGEAIASTLAETGIDVRTEATVTGADDTAVELEGDGAIPYEQLVWTGGIRGTDTMAADRPRVGPDLRLDEHTFVCGDAAQIEDTTGQLVPASAQSARRAARTAATNVARLIERDRTGTPTDTAELAQFHFTSPGWVVSVGDDAVATIGSRILTGNPAKTAKAAVSARYLLELGERRAAARLARLEVGG